MDARTVRQIAPVVYVVALLLAAFFASGAVTGAVAAIGAAILGGVYMRVRPTGGGRPRNQRERNRAAERSLDE